MRSHTCSKLAKVKCSGRFFTNNTVKRFLSDEDARPDLFLHNSTCVKFRKKPFYNIMNDYGRCQKAPSLRHPVEIQPKNNIPCLNKSFIFRHVKAFQKKSFFEYNCIQTCDARCARPMVFDKAAIRKSDEAAPLALFT